MLKFYQFDDNYYRIIIFSDFKKNNNDYISNSIESIEDINKYKLELYNKVFSNNFNYYFTLKVFSLNSDKFSLSAIYKNISKIFKNSPYFIFCSSFNNNHFIINGACYLKNDKIINNFKNFCDCDFILNTYKPSIYNYLACNISFNSIIISNNIFFYYSNFLKKPTIYSILPVNLDVIGFRYKKYNDLIVYDISLIDCNKQQLLFLIYNIKQKSLFFM